MMLDELTQTIEQLDQMRPSPMEVWISRHAPDKDAKGSWAAWKMPVKRPYLVGFFPETEEIVIMSKAVFAMLADDIFAVNIPVFKSGGIRVLGPPVPLRGLRV
jgi:hypothetical protein